VKVALWAIATIIFWAVIAIGPAPRSGAEVAACVILGALCLFRAIIAAREKPTKNDTDRKGAD